MSSKKKKIYSYLGKVILITLLIVFCIRTFLAEPYTVSSVQMENSLLQGDRILVDKTAYGVRLPITVLSIPFSFDNVLGMKSYSDLLQAPYFRIGESKVSKNDIILFNNPMETEKPLDKRSLILSRCVGIPGDSIEVAGSQLRINKNDYIFSPEIIREYSIKANHKKETEEAMEDMEIPLRAFVSKGDSLIFSLSNMESFILSEVLPDSIQPKPVIDSLLRYKFLIPFRGKSVSIDSQSILLYKQVILSEQYDKARFTDDTLWLDGVSQGSYTFQDDYYWVLSDNISDTTDSRVLGFIPFRNIIGKAKYIWYSSDKENTRCKRSFTSID